MNYNGRQKFLFQYELEATQVNTEDTFDIIAVQIRELAYPDTMYKWEKKPEKVVLEK